MDPHLDLAANPHPHPREHVERVGHAAVGRVLDRHQAEIRLLAMNLLEHGGDAADRHEFDALAETMDGGQVAVAVGGAKKGHAQTVSAEPASH